MGPCRRTDPTGPCRIYSLNGKVVWGRSPAEIAREFGVPPAAAAQGAETVPHLGGAGQESYQRYLGITKDRRAFALSQDGGFGWDDAWSTNEGTMKSALDKCQRLDPDGVCEICSLNGRIVWGDLPKRPVSTPAAATAAARPPAPAAAMAPAAVARAPAAGPVPHINAAGQQEYQHYENRAFHHAFFISATGGYGYGANTYMLSSALRIAAQNCERRDPKGICKPYSIGGHVVWGQDADTLPQFVDAPKLGMFTPTDYAPVLGPQKAKGMVIWSHGYLHGKDSTLYQPQG